MSHVADNGSIFHSVQLVPGHHVLISYRKAQTYTILIYYRRNKHSGALRSSGKLHELKTSYVILKSYKNVSEYNTFVLNVVTSACDNDVYLANDFIKLDHSESVHAIYTQKKEEIPHSAQAWTVTGWKISFYWQANQLLIGCVVHLS